MVIVPRQEAKHSILLDIEKARSTVYEGFFHAHSRICFKICFILMKILILMWC